MNLAANLIWLLHIVFVIFFVVAPFTNCKPLLLLHAMTGVLLFTHWYLNNDDCFLTLVECKLRGIAYNERQESFFWNLVNPIYKFESDQEMRRAVWMVSIGLWLITMFKIYKDPTIVTDTFYKAMYGPNFPKVNKVNDATVGPAKTVTYNSGPLTKVFSYPDGTRGVQHQRVLLSYTRAPDVRTSILG
jgi:uncharacterized membrane protein